VLKAFALFCRLLPPEAAQFVLRQLAQALVGGARAGGAAAGHHAGTGLYGLMNAAQALIDGLNLAYRLPERRSWLRRMAVAVLSLGGSAGFALYAAHLGNFTATYGLLASVAPLMLCLRLCGYAVLPGAAVNGIETRAD
jgi:uncharacterized BrkB/YihY/UPF0761 family membrane protein